MIKAAGYGNIVSVSSASEVIYLLKHAEFACGMRMHFMILSLLAESPFASVVYDTKCSYIYDELLKYKKDVTAFTQITDLDFEGVFDKLSHEARNGGSKKENFCKNMQKERGKFLFTLEKEQ